MEFKRPKGVIYPQVYDTFEVKIRDSDKIEEFVIQDLTEPFFSKAVEVIVDNHARGAVFHRAANTISSENGVRRVGEMYLNVIKEKISLVCLKVDTHEVVGVNALSLVLTNAQRKEQPSDDDPNFKLFKETVGYFSSQFNIGEHYNVDRYISASGLCVIEKYRGCGIASRILKARVPLLRTIGLTVTSTIFSTVGGQKAAASAGYEENYSISYEELKNKFPKLDISHVAGECCKVMSLKI